MEVGEGAWVGSSGMQWDVVFVLMASDGDILRVGRLALRSRRSRLFVVELTNSRFRWEETRLELGFSMKR